MTGIAWDVSNPLRPFALFDTDAIRVIPIEIGDLLDSMGTTYASHTVICEAPLQCTDQGTHVAGVIAIEVQMLAASAYTLNNKYPFTLRIIGQDGQQDDRTLWLKVVNR